MVIKIVRAFERTRQIADFVPIKAYCEATTEVEAQTLKEQGIIPSEFRKQISAELDQFCQAEVEKTLINYQPVCIVCKGKGANKTLNKEGICGQCVKELSIQAAEFSADAKKKRNENEPPATGTRSKPNQ